MSWPEIITLIGLGFVAGTLGGLLGIGGSVVMIPVLTLVLHHNQHVSQAAAMIVNFFVSAPAVLRHHGEGAVPWPIVRRALPAGLICIVIGVEASNLVPADTLKRLFGAFLLYVVVVNVMRLLGYHAEPQDDGERHGWVPVSVVGAITGLAAGLLGVGGGIIAVPLLQRLCHLPLRRAISASAALMCVTSMIGASRKNFILAELTDAAGVPLDPWESLMIAACLAPTALLGGSFGAWLTHVLPLRFLRLAFTLLLAVAALKLLGVA